MAKRETKIDKYLLITFGLFGFLFWHFAKEMLQIRSTGWYVGHINLYGDLVLHLSFINKFLQSGKVLIESPIYAGSKPNYPIFLDYVTSQIARVTGVDFALFITTFLAGLVVLFIARLFILNFIKNEKVVFITFLLFFLNGGFGFYYFFQDLLSSDQGVFGFLLNMPQEYTNIKEKGYWWINTYLAYFLPQRGFLLAFPITLLVLGLLYVGFKRGSKRLFMIAGLLAGTLPIIQAHSLFVLCLVSLFFLIFSLICVKEKKKAFLNWTIFAIVTLAIALPLFYTISNSANPLKFFRFDTGWTSQENIFWFWLKNLGLFAPLLILASIWLYRKNKHLFLLYIPFFILFPLSNIFLFQPWDFDNSKILVYWFFVSTIVVAYYLYDQFLTEDFARKIIGFALLFFMIFSGSLDLIRTFTKVTNYRIFSEKDLKVVSQVKTLIPKDTTFVTAPNHNHPIPALSGRSTLVGFHGWLWSHGIDYEKKAADVAKIYLGGQEAERLISQYRVSYVAIGVLERSAFSINDSYFTKYPPIFLGEEWILYDVSHLWANRYR